MKALLIFFILFSAIDIQHAKAGCFLQQFDKVAYYHILKSGNTKEINEEISLIDASSLDGKDAFKGALLMKKAGLLKVPKEKLDNFKSGRIKLETAMHNDSSNIEYYFLRLIIQEHAPKVVKYSSQINIDADYIKTNFKNLSPEVQRIVIDYSQTSKALKPDDFN